jgi:hypothetical protein
MPLLEEEMVVDPFPANDDPAEPEPVSETAPGKRAATRIPCRARVEWAYFNKPDRYEVQMLNHSDKGLYFESPLELIPGSTIMVRLQSRPSSCPQGGGPCSWPRTIGLGEVKWCRRIAGSEAPLYGVGVKYHVAV